MKEQQMPSDLCFKKESLRIYWLVSKKTHELSLTRGNKGQSLCGGPGTLPCPRIGANSERHIGQGYGQIDWQLGVQSSVHNELWTTKQDLCVLCEANIFCVDKHDMQPLQVGAVFMLCHRLTCWAAGVLYSTMYPCSSPFSFPGGPSHVISTSVPFRAAVTLAGGFSGTETQKTTELKSI